MIVWMLFTACDSAPEDELTLHGTVVAEERDYDTALIQIGADPVVGAGVGDELGGYTVLAIERGRIRVEGPDGRPRVVELPATR